MSTDGPVTGPAVHVDLATLADLDEELLAPAAAARVRGHLAGCPDCGSRLGALAGVRAALSAAPAEPIPADVVARLDTTLTGTDRKPPAVVRRTMPPAARRPRWRPSEGLLAGAAAASIVALLFGALVTGALRGGDSSSTGSSAGGRAGDSATVRSGPTAGVVATGRNYTAATLRAAVPGLLTGAGPPALPAPGAAAGNAPPTVANLGQPTALAACVTELAGRPGVTPLVVDLARYAGRPAAVVVLPETGRPSVLDVWVVGPGCTRGSADLLYFTRLSRPTGIRSP